MKTSIFETDAKSHHQFQIGTNWKILGCKILNLVWSGIHFDHFFDQWILSVSIIVPCLSCFEHTARNHVCSLHLMEAGNKFTIDKSQINLPSKQIS